VYTEHALASDFFCLTNTSVLVLLARGTALVTYHVTAAMTDDRQSLEADADHVPALPHPTSPTSAACLYTHAERLVSDGSAC